jgi:transposase
LVCSTSIRVTHIHWSRDMAWRTLSVTERQILERLRRDDNRAPVFRNATIILQSGDGLSKATLSQALGCSISTIDRVRRAYLRKGVAGLLPVPPPGRPSRATAAYRAALAEAIQTPPQALGYGFSTWNVPRLAAHLKKITKIGFSGDQLRRLLHQEGFSIQRPKHTMKGKRNEADFVRAKGELEALKKGLSSPTPRRS